MAGMWHDSLVNEVSPSFTPRLTVPWTGFRRVFVSTRILTLKE